MPALDDELGPFKSSLREREKLLAEMKGPLSSCQECLDRLAEKGALPGPIATFPAQHASEDKLFKGIGIAYTSLEELNQLDDTRKETAKQVRVLSDQLGRLRYRFLDWIIRTFTDGPTRRDRLGEFEEHLSTLNADREGKLQAMRKRGAQLHALLQAYCQAQCARINAHLERAAYGRARSPVPFAGPWGDPRWQEWPPLAPDGRPLLKPLLSSWLRVGEFTEDLRVVLRPVARGYVLAWLCAGLTPCTMPAFVPFIGQSKALVIECDNRTEAAGLAIMQSLIVRIAALLGRQALFTLLDPSGHGRSFPMQRFLNARKGGDDVNADLREVVQDIRRINQQVLTGEEGLHKLDGRRLASECFEIVVAADFPRGYDRRAIESLFNIAGAGPRAGRYVMIQHNRGVELPRDLSLSRVSNLFVIRPDQMGGDDFFTFTPDSLPDAATSQAILERVNSASRVDHSLDWDGIAGLPRERWWEEKSIEHVGTPIGLRGATDNIDLWFGAKQGRTCAHGMLGGMPGAGKSTLYHVLILGLAIRYAPEELKLYLVDGKFGTEFRPYDELPHAAVVSLNSPPELSRSVLRELCREMERRNDLFRNHGVEDLARYREKTGKSLPRVLLLVDEYHQMFEDDRDGAASEDLRRLAQQGRSAGLHMFLGSQRFGAAGMLHQRDIFGNIHIKVAMKMQPEEIIGLVEFGPLGKHLIRDCDLPGKFVINTTGRDEETIAGKAALLKSESRDVLIAELKKKAQAQGQGGALPVVFRGDRPPGVFENRALIERLRQKRQPHAKELETVARREEGMNGGFGQPGWVAADRPMGLWLGRLFNVHGHVMAVLRRGVGQNLLMVGPSLEARAGMLAGLLSSVAALYPPPAVRLHIFSAAADQGNAVGVVAQAFVERVLQPLGFAVRLDLSGSRIDSLLDVLIEELEIRQAAPGRDDPSLVALLLEPDRAPALRLVGDGITRAMNPRYDKLRRLLADGPPRGLHLVLATQARQLLAQVLDERKDLALFNHRVGLQMSEDDSFALFRNRKAAQLRMEGSPLACALYANMEVNQYQKFKPYSATVDRRNLDFMARCLAGQARTGS
jgi:S-DNA-T family DNA segregation ATPase FtsK/SpoIIIE